MTANDTVPGVAPRRFLIASDFDQTLSFNDSGAVLAEQLGVADFDKKVLGLSRCNLVQQGGELAYLIRHDPEFRSLRREHLIEAGRHVRLKPNIQALIELLQSGLTDAAFRFYVISAAPREVVESALDGILPPDHIIGTEFDYDQATGEVRSIRRVTAGYGKVAVLDELARGLGIPTDRVVYVGDGSSDVHVMLHVNNGNGFTIAVSENRQLAQIARHTVLSDNAFSIAVPLLERVLGQTAGDVHDVFAQRGLMVRDWRHSTTDRLSIDAAAPTGGLGGGPLGGGSNAPRGGAR